MSEKVIFTAVKSDREAGNKRYLNLVTADGRELTASYPLSDSERKPYHATPEWVDSLFQAAVTQTPIEVEIRDNKWLGMPGKQGGGGGGGGFRGKSQEERNEILALATLRDAVTMCVNSGKPYDVSMILSIHEKFYVNVLRLARGK